MQIQIPKGAVCRVDFAAANRLVRQLWVKLARFVFDGRIHSPNAPPTIEGSMVRLIISSRDERTESPSKDRTSILPLDAFAGVAA